MKCSFAWWLRVYPTCGRCYTGLGKRTLYTINHGVKLMHVHNKKNNRRRYDGRGVTYRIKVRMLQ